MAENAYLPISAIQHYVFCPRQFALIYMENQWNESYLTSSGRIMHKRVHDEKVAEFKGDVFVVRGLRLSSKKLKVYGVSDVVEYHLSENGIRLSGKFGNRMPYPVEYKRGKSKINDCDRLQLCVQCICLEEMHGVRITEGAIYYGKPRRREVVAIDAELREKAVGICEQAINMFNNRVTPEPYFTKACKSCSMIDICQPETSCKKAERYWERILKSI